MYKNVSHTGDIELHLQIALYVYTHVNFFVCYILLTPRYHTIWKGYYITHALCMLPAYVSITLLHVYSAVTTTDLSVST